MAFYMIPQILLLSEKIKEFKITTERLTSLQYAPNIAHIGECCMSRQNLLYEIV